MTRYRSRTQSWMSDAINSVWVPGPCGVSPANRAARAAPAIASDSPASPSGERAECHGELVDGRAEVRGQGRFDTDSANRATQQAQHRVREQVEVRQAVVGGADRGAQVPPPRRETHNLRCSEPRPDEPTELLVDVLACAEHPTLVDERAAVDELVEMCQRRVKCAERRLRGLADQRQRGRGEQQHGDHHRHPATDQRLDQPLQPAAGLLQSDHQDRRHRGLIDEHDPATGEATTDPDRGTQRKQCCQPQRERPAPARAPTAIPIPMPSVTPPINCTAR